MIWVSGLKQCSAKKGSVARFLIADVFRSSSFGETSACVVAQEADQGNGSFSTLFLPPTPRNSFQPDHFLLPACCAGLVLIREW